MSEARVESPGTLESTFYDGAVLDGARKKLVSLVALRKSPIVVTGESGTGKTILIRRVMKSLSLVDLPILLPDPRFVFQDVLNVILKHLRISNKTSAVDAKQPRSLEFVRWCLRNESAQGRYVTLFIDEAHDLDTELLSRLLELAQQPVLGGPFLGLVLVGLPDLEAKVLRPQSRDFLRAGLTRFRLRPLGKKGTEEFVRYFLLAKGRQGNESISSEALAQVWEHSHGVLSKLNRLCCALLFVAEKKGADRIDVGIAKEAAALCSLSLDPLGNSLHPTDVGHRLEQLPRSGVAAGDSRDESERDSLGKQALPTVTEQAKPEQDTTPSSPRETPMDRTTQLNKVLKNLQNGSPDVEACALITDDGLMIASSLPQDLDEITVGGMSATLLNLGTRAAAELRRGDVKEVIVRGDDGYGVMVSAGRGVLLLVVANERAKLGLIFFDMRTAINAIKQIL